MFWFDLPEAIAEIAKDIKYLIRQVTTHTRILNYMSTRLEKILFVVKENSDLKTELAATKQQLADALANDAADAATIATAQTKADTAKAEAQTAKDALAPLQELADTDATEDSSIDQALESVEVPV